MSTAIHRRLSKGIAQLRQSQADLPQPRAPLGVAARILVVVLTTWSLGSIIPDLWRVVMPSLGAAGFAADNDGRIYDVIGPFANDSDSPAWQAGLRVGDQVDLRAMRCDPLLPDGPACSSLISVVGGMGGIQLVRPGRILTLTIRPADGSAERTVTIRAKQPYRSWFTRFVLLLNECAGIAFVLAATWLVWTRPGAMTMGFWLYSLWFNPGQYFVYYLLLQEHPGLELVNEVLASAIHGGASAGLLLFVLRVPDDRPDQRWRWAERVVPAVGIVMAAMQLASYSSILGFKVEAVSRATFFADYIVDALAVAILLRRRQGHLPEDYQRFQWVLWGCAIGLPAYILSGLLQSTSLWQTVSGSHRLPYALINLLLVVYAMMGWFIFEAVRRPSVVAVSIPLRRATVFGLILSLPALLAHEETDRLREMLHLPDWGWLIFAAVLLFLISRLHELSAELADHVFNRSFHRHAQQLAEIRREILAAENAESIDRLLSEAPRDRLNLASATVFRHEAGVYRRHLRGLGWPPDAADTLDPDDDAFAELAHAEPFHISRGDAKRLAFPPGLATPTFAVPVRNTLYCYAVAFYGPHVSGADLAGNEHALLASLAADAALVYARAETEVLRRRVAALEDQLDELTDLSPEP
jgi:hypothetical protein